MVVKFDVAAPFNFSNYQYWIVFNTTGNGLTPDTFPFNNNWAAYSAGIKVGGAGGATYAVVGQWVRNTNPASPPTFLPLGTTPQQLQYTANSNGSGTEFTVLFQRQIFTPIAPTPSPADIAAKRISVARQFAATPSPSPTPTLLPFATNWTFNAFVTQGNLAGQPTFVDSLGAGGPVNPQYQCCNPPVAINSNFDNTYYALFSGTQLDPAAQIISIEIGNNWNDH